MANTPPSQLDRIEAAQSAIAASVTRIEAIARTSQNLLLSLVGLQGETMADLSTLTAQVKANTDLEASAVVAFTQLADLFKQNATDQNAVNALADQLKASAQTLAAAIPANTPAAPPAGP